ncbi:MAG: 4-hydroxy-3-methylbut-2-enyl diphosphate reductase [Candidatus Krumholzibacteria bacterium]|nr:4-hydroxy-3-methylbut-2-enyl diphosphate reductase [Candidatus Krumholzibacteria bacterium]
MVRKFDIPAIFRGRVIARIKKAQESDDPRKRELAPTVLDFGSVRLVLARHFGFCYGVENAVEIAYKTLESHPRRRVFLLSEIIHNSTVNGDLRERGVRFIFSPSGEQLVPWEELAADDIVVVPAFGTTLELQRELADRGIDPYAYNTTCPFVEKVWKRSTQLGRNNCTVVVHGKATHEETRATFSHSIIGSPTVVVLDLSETRVLADVIEGKLGAEAFDRHFRHKCSNGFDPERHLERIGVVNQTTMLATETQEIARVLRQAMANRYGPDNLQHHFADTSDTLCYATNENQNATYALIEHGADISLVIGGYNSSNTSHIVELCREAMPTYFIQTEREILSAKRINHFDLEKRQVITTDGWLPEKRPLDIVVTCGASCPDAIVDEVLLRVLSFFEKTRPLEDVLRPYPALVDEG